jgi:hypothetical protein
MRINNKGAEQQSFRRKNWEPREKSGRLKLATTWWICCLSNGVPMQEDDEIISGCAAIARELGRSPRSTFDLLEGRKIPATKLGGVWTSTRNVLRAYIATMAKAGA